MTPEKMAEWREQRAKGRARFVLVTGVASYGVPMYLATTFAPPLLFGRPMPSPVALAIGAALWLAGGVLFGFTLFWVNERNYRLAEQRKDA